MKKILYTVISLYLLFQAAVGVLSIFGAPENALIALALSALSGYGAYWFGQKARAIFLAENAPADPPPTPGAYTREAALRALSKYQNMSEIAPLDAPETNKLDKP